MDLTTIKSGEEIVIGALVGHRFWRYQLYPLRLLSWCLNDRDWLPGEPFEADKLPELDNTHGVHAYKTAQGLADYLGRASELTNEFGLELRVMDGIVIGTVALWGAVAIFERAYRAQYARPLSFTQAYGRCSNDTLIMLRSRFLRPAEQPR